MPALTDARNGLAAAVTSTGMDCTAYAPDAPQPPCAWVDSVGVAHGDQAPGAWTLPGRAQAAIITCAQRNDRAAGLKDLEDRIPAILAALTDITGVRVTSIQSGDTEIGTINLPAVTYLAEFFLADT